MTGRLVPDYKTIADFRKDNGPAFRKVCAQFVALCRRLELFADASVAIDGSKFKAVTLTFGEESVRGQATASDQDRIRCQPPIVLPWSVTGGRQLANLGSNRSNETDKGRIFLFHFLSASAHTRSMGERPYTAALKRLRAAGLRPTRQRLALTRLLFAGTDRHITAEALHKEARANNVRVLLATIYNTLNQFTEAGMLREVVVDALSSYFDTNVSHHHHFFCVEDRNLVDIPG